MAVPLKQFFEKLDWRSAWGMGLAIGISALIIIFEKDILLLGKFGYFGVFIVSLLINASLILPAPSLLVIMAFGRALPNPLLVGLAAGLGSTLGELTGFLAGTSGRSIVTSTKVYKQAKHTVRKYGLVAIFFLALIPNPMFDLAGIAAGALGFKWWQFLLVTGVGKTIRTIFLAYLGANTK